MIKLRKSIKLIRGIYGFRNKISNKIYVGSAENVRSRVGWHLHQLLKNNHSNKELQKDFNIYGIDNIFPIVFKYLTKKQNKFKMEEQILKLLINNNIQVYNSMLPYKNQTFKLAISSTTRYILTNKLLKRTYNNVLNLKDFYMRNKCYNCPSQTKLYSMVANKTEYNNWTIEIDTQNTQLDVITRRTNKFGSTYKNSKYYNTYNCIISWEITNIKTKTVITINNLMAWCTTNNIHYNQFQRYKDTDRVYKDEWKLKKI